MKYVNKFGKLNILVGIQEEEEEEEEGTVQMLEPYLHWLQLDKWAKGDYSIFVVWMLASCICLSKKMYTER